MKTTSRLLGLTLLSFLAMSATAHAHQLPGDVRGFTSGLAHPLNGLDHLLTMVAVGLWAAQLGGRSRWLVPASFVSVMTLGATIAMAGFHIPFVEHGILLSVMVLGLLVALSVRMPVMASMAVVALFALFHGHSHGTEMPVNAVGFAYGTGFVLATAILHAGGIGLAYIVGSARLPAVRWAGATITACGLALCVF